MSWLDPARSEESAEDLALRGELQEMLALPPRETPQAVTPELVALAETLRLEATHRRRVRPLQTRQRRTWMLLAAGLPLLLILGSTGIWGLQQKRKAEALAAKVKEREMEMERRERILRDAQQRERQAITAPAMGATQQAVVNASREQRRKPQELIIQSHQGVPLQPLGTHQVKDPK